MLTVTRDMILPPTITGSYPRPLWFDRSLAGRSFKSALGDSLFREQYLDAVASIIAEQEAAGLDNPHFFAISLKASVRFGESRTLRIPWSVKVASMM